MPQKINFKRNDMKKNQKRKNNLTVGKSHEKCNKKLPFNIAIFFTHILILKNIMIVKRNLNG